MFVCSCFGEAGDPGNEPLAHPKLNNKLSSHERALLALPMAHPDTKLFWACHPEMISHLPSNEAQVGPEARERAALCHLQLKCQLPLDRGCCFEVAGWVSSWELPEGGLQERGYTVWFSTELSISVGPFNSL